jgi:hypothetical protein
LSEKTGAQDLLRYLRPLATAPTGNEQNLFDSLATSQLFKKIARGLLAVHI